MRNFITILLIFNLLFFSVAGQNGYKTRSRKAIYLYENAGREYQLLNYTEAIKLLTEALKADAEFIEAWLLLGQVYTDNKNIEESINAYNTAISLDPGFFPPVYYLIAQNEFSIGRYKQAGEHMQAFLSTRYGSEEMKVKATKLINDCDFSIHLIAHPVPFEPLNLGPNINTSYDEYWPSLSVDESIMVFTKQIPIDENNPRVYMNRQEDFFYSEFKDGQWQPAENAGYPPNTDNNEKQPSVSSDGKMLYFVSDRQGGKGGYDVWISQQNNDGTWMEPVNAGDSINSSEDEQSPFIHPDNQTLYFSSSGWPGLGKYDIYISRKNKDNHWSLPVNIGYPINTWNNEEGLIVNSTGNKAYFSSDRLGDHGRDIFEFELYENVRPVKVSYMKGKVYDSETWQRLQAQFELIDLNSGEIFMKSVSEQQTGEFLVCIPANTDYALNVSKKGYLFYSDHFSLEKVYERTEPYLKDIPLQPIKVGQSIILRNVFYAYNSYELISRSRIELEKVVQLMNENPSLVVEISGHTDNTGTAEYNQGLSEKRAGSVKDYLVNHGIASERMTTKGYGLTRPVETNETEEGRSSNRRTELMILEK